MCTPLVDSLWFGIILPCEPHNGSVARNRTHIHSSQSFVDRALFGQIAPHQFINTDVSVVSIPLVLQSKLKSSKFGMFIPHSFHTQLWTWRKELFTSQLFRTHGWNYKNPMVHTPFVLLTFVSPNNGDVCISDGFEQVYKCENTIINVTLFL